MEIKEERLEEKKRKERGRGTGRMGKAEETKGEEERRNKLLRGMRGKYGYYLNRKGIGGNREEGKRGGERERGGGGGWLGSQRKVVGERKQWGRRRIRRGRNKGGRER